MEFRYFEKLRDFERANFCFAELLGTLEPTLPPLDGVLVGNRGLGDKFFDISLVAVKYISQQNRETRKAKSESEIRKIQSSKTTNDSFRISSNIAPKKPLDVVGKAIPRASEVPYTFFISVSFSLIQCGLESHLFVL